MSLPRNVVRMMTASLLASGGIAVAHTGAVAEQGMTRIYPSESTRVWVGARKVGANAWTTDGTSNAGLRSDSRGMVPGAADSTHLRVRNGLDSLNLFR